MMSALRVELFFDEEAGNWHYRVPALHINGGAPATREDAERDCLAAIGFALEGDPRDYDTDAETVVLDVNVASAARGKYLVAALADNAAAAFFFGTAGILALVAAQADTGQFIEPFPDISDLELYQGGPPGRSSRQCRVVKLRCWRSITSGQFLGYGPALSVAVPAGPAGLGRVYRPRPVLERKPRRVHSASWVSRSWGFTPSRTSGRAGDPACPLLFRRGRFRGLSAAQPRNDRPGQAGGPSHCW